MVDEEVKATSDQTILDRKFITSLIWNFHFDSIDILSLTLTYENGLNT